ncbi:MAG TPA: type II secretion system minor pseudopilin GspH [Solimonas sp.]|nr:type II secretion system minor pseudopilin GspH [Solimonas sp.]
MRRPLSVSASQRGFTLLEILVVVLIIGILVTFASLSISSRSLEDRLEFEARRIDQTLRLALEEAELKGLLIGFRYLPDRYEFLSPGQDGDWEAFTAGPLRPRALTAPFEIELRVEGRVVPPAQESRKEKERREKAKDDDEDDKDSRKGGETGSLKKKGKDEKSDAEPQVLLLPSGEVTAFTLGLRVADLQSRYLISADALGKFEFKRDEGRDPP